MLLKKQHPAIITELIDAAVTILAIILIQITFSNIANDIGDMMDSAYTLQLITLPVFEYSIQNDGTEHGNYIFETFTQMRFLALILIAVVVVVAVLLKFFEQSEVSTVQKGLGGKLISRCVMIIFLIALFPFIWDAVADGMEIAAVWVLNPNYSYDPDSPCPDDWSDQKIIREYNDSKYDKDGTAYDFFGTDIKKAEIVCRPDFKVHYVIQQMAGTASYELPEGANTLEWITNQISGAFTNVLADTFFGFAQAIIVINVSLLSMIISMMTDMLTAMVIVSLPLFLALSLIPRFDKIVAKFLQALPGLYLIPLVSAIVISVGASFIASAGTANTGEIIAGFDTTLIYVWIASLGVVFFAVSIPMLMVPLLSSVVGSTMQVMTSAVTTALFITAMAGKGAIQGYAKGGFKGSVSGGIKGGITAHEGSAMSSPEKDGGAAGGKGEE